MNSDNHLDFVKLLIKEPRQRTINPEQFTSQNEQ